MPNAYKYATASVAGTIRKSNIALGINSSVDYGPTDTTDFWNGITPPTNGYTIYVTKSIQGPSIQVAHSDNQLIQFIQQYEPTITSVSGALDWAVRRNNILISNRDYGDIVTNGLKFAVDPTFVASAPKSSSRLHDIAVNGLYTGSYAGGATWVNTSSGSLSFGGSIDYMDFGDPGNIGVDLTDKTICCWINKTANGNYGLVDKDFDNGAPNYGGWGFWIQSNNKLWWWNHANLDLLDNGTATVSNNTWTHCAVTYDYTNKTARFYINATLNSTRTNTNIVEKSSAGARLLIGETRNGAGFSFSGRIGPTQIYNRVLTATEITQNYNAQKGLYGL
jgi:hypothetical protein